jgi:septum formation protein
MLKEKIVLASQSPRRAEILRSVGWDFEAIPADIDESRYDGEDAGTYVQRLARGKAQTIAEKTSAPLVVGADTTVVIDHEVLGQPIDDDDAQRMLSLLSGRWHEVVTGVALWRGSEECQVRVEKTRVRFAHMSPAEIDWYVATGEPRGKAGAYAIQGKAAFFIEEIEGDYFNVVGLPIRLVYEMIRGSGMK